MRLKKEDKVEILKYALMRAEPTKKARALIAVYRETVGALVKNSDFYKDSIAIQSRVKLLNKKHGTYCAALRADDGIALWPVTTEELNAALKGIIPYDVDANTVRLQASSAFSYINRQGMARSCKGTYEATLKTYWHFHLLQGFLTYAYSDDKSMGIHSWVSGDILPKDLTIEILKLAVRFEAEMVDIKKDYEEAYYALQPIIDKATTVKSLLAAYPPLKAVIPSHLTNPVASKQLSVPTLTIAKHFKL